MLKIFPLFSGSSGNCTLVRSDNANILIDAGMGCKLTSNALANYGLSPSDITAIVVTHEHGDHIGGIAQWCKRCPTPVYARRQIADIVCERTYCSDVTFVDKRFEIADVTVETYECSHDAISCVGYRFTDSNGSVASVTDTGKTDNALVDFLAPCDVVQLESNHDVNMLKNGPYPYPLKRRILSDFGHLSNEQAADLLEKLIGSNVKKVILAHLSEHNNTAELAFNAVVEMYARNNLVEGRDIDVRVARQRDNEVTND